MKNYQKICLMFLVLAFITATLSSHLFAWDKWKKDDPFTDEWNMIDLLVARPLGVAASVVGLGIFTISLPFTLTVDIFARTDNKTSSAVSDSAKILILNPLKFSFTREFPDENM